MALKHQALPDQATQENFLDVDNRLGFFEGKIYRGFGTPEGNVKAEKGAIYLNDSGGASTSLYMKETGTDNTGWSPVGAASAAGAHNLLSATHPDTLADSVIAGDLIIGNATPKWARLPAGSNGQVLTLSGGLPAWAAASGGSTALLDGSTHTDTTNSAVTRGDLIVGNSTPAWDDLAIGAAGFILNSDGSDPSWGNTLTSAAAAQTLRLIPTGGVSASTTAGGALFLDNTSSTGAGGVFYSNQGAGATGRLLVVNVVNTANPQAAVRIQNAGTNAALSINNTGASTGPSALDVTSSDRTVSAIGFQGAETGKGTLKVTHSHPVGASANDDANASILRLNWEDLTAGANGSAVQGIFMASEGGATGAATTGDLIKIWNGGSTGGTATTKLWLDPNGQLALNTTGTTGGLLLGADVLLYRSAPNKLSLGAGDSFDSPTILTPTIAATDWNAAQHTHLGATTGGTLTRAAVSDFLPITSSDISNGAIVNADINASAAIDFSKLAALTSAHILVGSAGNVATDVAVTGDVTISNAGVTAIGTGKVTSTNILDGTILNADVNASAAIDATKINTGVVSNAEFNFLDGVTSAIQTQIDGKQPLDTDLTEIAALANVRGDLLLTNSGANWARLGIGAANTVLHSDGTDATWQSLTTADLPVGIDHHANLTNFTANDDHTQYALLAGRSGGQTLKGGTAASETLTLMSTSHATLGSVTSADQLTLTTQGTTGGIVIGGDAALFRAAADVVAVGSGDSFIGRTVAGSGAASGTLTLQSTTNATKAKIVAEDRLQVHTNSATTTAAYNVIDMMSGSTVTLNGASAAFRGFFIPSTAVISITADPAAVSMQMFGLSPSVTSTGNRTVGLTTGANFAPQITPASASTTTWGFMTAFSSLPNLVAPGGGGTATLSGLVGHSAGATVSTGWTVTDYINLSVSAPTGAGTVTNWYGLNIADPGSYGSTTKVSIQSLGASAYMAHAGPALFGSTSGVSGTAGSNPTVELERVSTITGTVADGLSGSLALDPGYTAATAQTVTRHNYIDAQDVSNAGAGPSAVTDSAVVRFDANTGTHKALASNATVATTLGSTGPTGSTAGAPQGWMKINVNGTLRYIPFW